MTLLKTLLSALFVFHSLTAGATTPQICAEALMVHISETKDHQMSLSEFELALIGRAHATVLVTVPITNSKGSLFNIAQPQIAPGLTARPEFSVYHQGHFSYVVHGDYNAWDKAYDALEKLGARYQILNSTLNEKTKTLEYPREHLEITADMDEKEVEAKILASTNPYVLLHHPTEQTYVVYPAGHGVRLSGPTLERFQIGGANASKSITESLLRAPVYSQENKLSAANFGWGTFEFFTHSAFMRVRRFLNDRVQDLKTSTVTVSAQLQELLNLPNFATETSEAKNDVEKLEETPPLKVAEPAPVEPEPIVVVEPAAPTPIIPDAIPPETPEPIPVTPEPIVTALSASDPMAVAPSAPAPETVTAEIRPAAILPSPETVRRAPVLQATVFARESDYEEFIAILKQAAVDRPNEIRPRNFLRDGSLGLVKFFAKPEEVHAYRVQVLEYIKFGDYDSRARVPFANTDVRARVLRAANMLAEILDVQLSTPEIQPAEAEELFNLLKQGLLGTDYLPTIPAPEATPAAVVGEVPVTHAALPPPVDVGLHFEDEADYRVFVDLLRRNSIYWPSAPPSHYLRDATIGFLKKLVPSHYLQGALDYVQKEINFDSIDVRTGAVARRPETRARVMQAAKMLNQYSDQVWDSLTVTHAQAVQFFARLNQVAPEAHDYRFEDDGDLDLFLKTLSEGTKTTLSKQFLAPALLKMIRVAVKPSARAQYEAYVHAQLQFEYSDSQYIQSNNPRRVALMHLLFGIANEFKIDWTRPVVTHEQAQAVFNEMAQRLASPPTFNDIPPARAAIRFESEDDYKQFVSLLNECSAYWQFAPMPHIPFNDAMLGLLTQIAPPDDQERLRKTLVKDIHFRLTDNAQSVISESTDGRVRIMKAANLLAEELRLDWDAPTISHAQFETFYARLRRLAPKQDDLGFANPAQFDQTLQVITDLAGIPAADDFAPTALMIVAEIVTRPENKANLVSSSRDDLATTVGLTEKQKIMRVLYRLADEIGVIWSRPRVSRAQASDFLRKLKERATAAAAEPPIEPPTAASSVVETDANLVELPPIDQAFGAIDTYLKSSEERPVLDESFLLSLLREAFPQETETSRIARLALIKITYSEPRVAVAQTWKAFATERLGPEYAQTPLTPATLARVREQFLIEDSVPAAGVGEKGERSEVEVLQLMIDFMSARIKFGDIYEPRGLRQSFLDTIQPVVNRLKSLRLRSDIQKTIANKEFLNLRYRSSTLQHADSRHQIFAAWNILRKALELPNDGSGKITGASVEETIQVYKERFLKTPGATSAP